MKRIGSNITNVDYKVRKCTQDQPKVVDEDERTSTRSMDTADSRQSSSIQQQLLGTRDPIDTSSPAKKRRRTMNYATLSYGEITKLNDEDQEKAWSYLNTVFCNYSVSLDDKNTCTPYVLHTCKSENGVKLDAALKTFWDELSEEDISKQKQTQMVEWVKKQKPFSITININKDGVLTEESKNVIRIYLYSTLGIEEFSDFPSIGGLINTLIEDTGFVEPNPNPTQTIFLGTTERVTKKWDGELFKKVSKELNNLTNVKKQDQSFKKNPRRQS